MNTNDTTPATESQHPRTNEDACESSMERDFEMMHLRDEVARLHELAVKRRDLILELYAGSTAARRALAAEQAAHALTRETYETGAKMNAAVNDSLRARITELCDAGDRFLVALRADQDENTRETYDEVADAKLALAGAIAKHSHAGVSGNTALDALTNTDEG